MKVKLVCALVFALVAGRAAAQNEPKQTLYPQHGEVISSRIEGEAVGSAGVVGTLKRWVYRVDCGEQYYELQGKGKQSLTIGQKIDFRIEKGKAFLLGDKKGKSYRLVGMGKPQPEDKPASN